MTTATKERRTAKAEHATPSGRLNDRLAAERRELLDAADAIAFRVAGGDALNADDQIVFATLGWDDTRVRREIGRAKGVLRWKALAGTAAEYTTAKREAQAAADALAGQGAKITAQIEALQAELRRLEANVNRSTSRIESMTTARRNLADVKVVPEHMARAYHQARRNLSALPLYRERLDIESRLHAIAGALVMPFSEARFTDEADAIVRHCSSLPKDHPAHPREIDLKHGQGDTGKAFRRTVSREAWTAYLEELKAEKPQLERRHEQITEQLAPQEREADALLNHYAAKL